MKNKNIINIFICLGFVSIVFGCSEKKVLITQKSQIMEQTQNEENKNATLKKRTIIQKNQEIKTPHEEYINLF